MAKEHFSQFSLENMWPVSVHRLCLIPCFLQCGDETQRLPAANSRWQGSLRLAVRNKSSFSRSNSVSMIWKIIMITILTIDDEFLCVCVCFCCCSKIETCAQRTRSWCESNEFRSHSGDTIDRGGSNADKVSEEGMARQRIDELTQRRFEKINREIQRGARGSRLL